MINYSNMFFYDNKENDITKSIINKLKIYDKNILDLLTEINNFLNSKFKSNKCCDHVKNFTWGPCDDCKKLTKYGDLEIASTSYILRCLRDSIISNNTQNNNYIIRFSVSVSKELTGKWENDKNLLFLTGYGVGEEKLFNKENSIIQTETKNTKGNLIMGLGPSSAGKTYSAKKIIEIINVAKAFISIDGGSYRESSLVYTYIKDQARERCVGITNLFEKIFKVSEIKKSITNFLAKQNNIQLNLYVPETLVADNVKAMEKINTYSNIVKDENWTCILIWQHKYSTDCNITNTIKHFILNETPQEIKDDLENIISCYNFQCKGCSESGAEREVKEGKKYNKKSWSYSMTLGKYILHNSLHRNTGRNFSIHNTGGKGEKSILVEYKNDEKNENETVKVKDKDKDKDVLKIDYNYKKKYVGPLKQFFLSL